MQWLARYLMADSGSPPCVRCAWFLIRRSVGWSVCLSPLPDRRTDACRHRGEEAFRGCAAMVRWPPGAVFGQSAAGCAKRGRGGEPVSVSACGVVRAAAWGGGRMGSGPARGGCAEPLFGVRFFRCAAGRSPFAVQGVRYVHCRSGRCRRMTACNECPRSAAGRHDAPFVFGRSAEAGPAGIALSPPDARCRPAMPTAGCRPLGGGRQSLRRMLFCCGCRSACGFARLRRTSKAAGRRMIRNHRSGARNVRPVPQGFSNGRTSILRGRLTARASFCCGAGGASGRMTGASAGSAFSFLACRREAEILLLAPRASVRRSGLGSSE